MKILMSGATGMVGTALRPILSANHQVARLRRLGAGVLLGDARWDPATGAIDPAGMDGADAIVHLAGESLAAGRWTEPKKKAIYDSRVGPTRALCEMLARSDKPPRVLICASAIGYYGDCGDEWLDESSPRGSSFLADVVEAWEQATHPAVANGIRVVNLRFAIILSPRGGALKKMLLPFKLGVGGVIGSGKQYWSWVSIDDVVGAIQFALTNEGLSGPVNVVAPNPATNREFSVTLARVLKRPAVLPLPAFVARAMLGEMADEMLLSSTRVRAAKLSAGGFHFRDGELGTTLRRQLDH